VKIRFGSEGRSAAFRASHSVPRTFRMRTVQEPCLAPFKFLVQRRIKVDGGASSVHTRNGGWCVCVLARTAEGWRQTKPFGAGCSSAGRDAQSEWTTEGVLSVAHLGGEEPYFWMEGR
jgi:hypothetical protein